LFTEFIDEFQWAKGGIIEDIVSQSRKFGFALVMNHQFLTQLKPATQSAVLGCAKTQVVFRLGGDAAQLANELGGSVTERDIKGLANFSAYIKL
jgi:DNA helicase HerA-like ATPase